MNFVAANKKTSKKSTLTATFADGTTATRTTANPYGFCARRCSKMGDRDYVEFFWSRTADGAAKAARAAANRVAFAWKSEGITVTSTIEISVSVA